MVITKTPLRASFVGGGSDLPAYYREHGGAVLSSAIKKYIYVMVKPRFEPGYRVCYSTTEAAATRHDIRHPLVRGALTMLDIDEDLEIISAAEIPSSGSGLGSSSSFSVGLINGLLMHKGQKISAIKSAELACRLEIEIAGSPIGKQDQFAASVGGLNVFRFHSDESVTVEKVNCLDSTRQNLDRDIIGFYIGGARDANKILGQQSLDITKTDKTRIMTEMVKLVSDLKHDLEVTAAENFGNILHKNWILKRQLSGGITNQNVDSIYSEGLSCGASGGKLLGAGGGGFMIFHTASEDIRTKIRKRFYNLREVDFTLEANGSSVSVF